MKQSGNAVLRFKNAALGGALALGIGLTGFAAAQTPIADVSCLSDMASPEASAVASPVASAEPRTGESVTDQATIDSATSAVASCHTDVEGLEVVDVIAYTDGTYGVVYQYNVGKQYFRSTDVFEVNGATWTAIEHTAESPETDEDTATASVVVGGADAPVDSQTGTVPGSPATRVTTSNAGDATVTVTMYQSSDEAIDPSTITGTSADVPDSLTAVGNITLAGGEKQDMLFVGLDQGTYVFVATDADGNILGAGTLGVDAPIDTGL